jgi:hypothetical protein
MKDVMVAGWTVETLKIHMETLMKEQDRRYEQVALASDKTLQAALLAVKEATTETKQNAAVWHAHQNEWRQAMSDKDRAFITKAAMWGYMVGAAGVILALVAIVELLLRIRN